MCIQWSRSKTYSKKNNHNKLFALIVTRFAALSNNSFQYLKLIVEKKRNFVCRDTTHNDELNQV